jgi:predicted RNase H-related nuclease YkuK (DUF458 family)
MKFDFVKIKEYIEAQGPDTKIYIGCDSERFRKNDMWYADYTLAIVVHIDGKHGCKIFGEVQTEKDYDQRKNKPRMRLMNEVIKIANLYLELEKLIDDRPIEVHLDINPDEMFGSSCVVSEAIGYIKGMCNVVPFVKPKAFAATYCADRLKEIVRVA